MKPVDIKKITLDAIDGAPVEAQEILGAAYNKAKMSEPFITKEMVDLIQTAIMCGYLEGYSNGLDDATDTIFEQLGIRK